MDIVKLLPVIYEKFILFTLIFTRIAALLSTFVLFRRELITSRLVISLSIILSLYVLLAYAGKSIVYDVFSIDLLIQMLFQSFIGLVTGLILNLLFEVFVSAGQIISTQIGFSTASLIDPRFGYITSLTHFYMIVSTLLFLILNGHLFAIKAIVDSFNVLPLYKEIIPANLLIDVLNYAGVIFSGAIMLSITIITVLLLTNIALAIMTKFAPQFNLFSIGINMQSIIGLICIYVTFNLYMDNSGNLIRDCLAFLMQTLHEMR
jgi:flagellar biosynthetic protein FliR